MPIAATGVRCLGMLVLAVTLGGCATERFEHPPPSAPQYALEAMPDGGFAGVETAIRGKYGPDVSGFDVLDRNQDGLRWRLALIDSARHSIDAQYYLWYGDAAGRLMVEHLLRAADRGVRVRVIIDDINTLIRDAKTVQIGDEIVALIDAHPNVELRLFNPWRSRGLLERAGEMLGDLGRLNQRMHNKALIVDNQAAILGGRNIGDEYMGLSPEFNFHDLDVLGVGPVARQASTVFDSFWNSEWVAPVSALKLDTLQADVAAGRAKLQASLHVPALADFPLEPQSWAAEIDALSDRLLTGTSRVYSDIPEHGQIRHLMREVISTVAGYAQREYLVTNAYIIPDDRGIAGLKNLEARGVQTRILTNSLATHDVPAVNSHYKKWRKPLVGATAGLYELRADAAIHAGIVDTPPTRSEHVGLHSKGMVVDREFVYIGSMNFDPRSIGINSEMGVFVRSPALGEALAKIMERDMSPENSWRVEIGSDGDLRWVHGDVVLTRQPALSTWQRVQDVIFMAFPKDYY